MYKQINDYQLSETLNTGININDYSDHTYIFESYKHGRIEDLQITSIQHPSQKYFVSSRNLIDTLRRLAINLNLSGELVFQSIRKENPYSQINSLKLDNCKYSITYKCNSRKVLKPINELTKTLKGMCVLANIPYHQGIYSVTDMLLIRALHMDTLDACKFLEKYSPKRIVLRLNSPKFKHLYKISHPETEFIKTLTEQP